jgi:hypothetical protein
VHANRSVLDEALACVDVSGARGDQDDRPSPEGISAVGETEDAGGIESGIVVGVDPVVEPDTPRLACLSAEAAAASLEKDQEPLRVGLPDPERVAPAPGASGRTTRLDPLPLLGFEGRSLGLVAAPCATRCDQRSGQDGAEQELHDVVIVA